MSESTKVIVWRARPGIWCWSVGTKAPWNRNIVFSDGPDGTAPSQPVALALGLAALATATAEATATLEATP